MEFQNKQTLIQAILTDEGEGMFYFVDFLLEDVRLSLNEGNYLRMGALVTVLGECFKYIQQGDVSVDLEHKLVRIRFALSVLSAALDKVPPENEAAGFAKNCLKSLLQLEGGGSSSLLAA